MKRRTSVQHAKAQRQLLYMSIVICVTFALCALPRYFVVHSFADEHYKIYNIVIFLKFYSGDRHFTDLAYRLCFTFSLPIGSSAPGLLACLTNIGLLITSCLLNHCLSTARYGQRCDKVNQYWKN